MDEKRQVNTFTQYKQLENHFTNGLISILKLSSLEDSNLINHFLKELLGLDFQETWKSFQVLQYDRIKSTVDAQIFGENTSIQFETKITTAGLTEEQIERHCRNFESGSTKNKILILLTPDDSKSSYIRKFINLHPSIQIVHLSWIKVYRFFESFYQKTSNVVLKHLVVDYLDSIKTQIFEQDIVGIILKVSFTEKTGVDHTTYIEEMRNGEWIHWNTPREYKNLDGTSRKLLLYDRNLRAITIEVEITKVEKTENEKDFPWTNHFLEDSLIIFDPPIPAEVVTALDGFAGFTREHAPYRNITHEQYRQIINRGKK